MKKGFVIRCAEESARAEQCLIPPRVSLQSSGYFQSSGPRSRKRIPAKALSHGGSVKMLLGQPLAKLSNLTKVDTTWTQAFGYA